MTDDPEFINQAAILRAKLARGFARDRNRLVSAQSTNELDHALHVGIETAAMSLVALMGGGTHARLALKSTILDAGGMNPRVRAAVEVCMEQVQALLADAESLYPAGAYDAVDRVQVFQRHIERAASIRRTWQFGCLGLIIAAAVYWFFVR